MTYAFTDTIRKGMEAKKVGLRQLADHVGCSSEHVRKLSNSLAFPSPSLRDKIAEVLQIDRKEFEEQVNADRWRFKYKKIPAVAEVQHPIYALWNRLTADQQTSVLCVAECLAKLKKRKSTRTT